MTDNTIYPPWLEETFFLIVQKEIEQSSNKSKISTMSKFYEEE
jgi:hypothetical protein